MNNHQPVDMVKTLTVSLDDGSHVQYTMRGLREDEVSKWAIFCASVFAYKANPPPPSYFERHYVRDPQRGDASLIRVIVYHDDTLVASCRIFPRLISSGSSKSSVDNAAAIIRGGGIGEVCTDDRHRRRGLSKFLLQDAIRIMKERHMQVSLLHAAPDFFPVYQSVGYACSHSKWSVVSIHMNNNQLANMNTATVSTISNASQQQPFIRHAEFPKDTERLQSIHQVYSEQRFAGCITRSADYWNQYLCHELQGSLWVLVAPPPNTTASDGDDDEPSIMAWISVRQRGDRYQVREFGCDEHRITTAAAFPCLLSHALSQLNASTVTSDCGEALNLCLPTFLLNDMGGTETLDWLSNVVPEDDYGWMYKSLTDDELATLIAPDSLHLIWPSDSF